jgi:hypothetical protein
MNDILFPEKSPGRNAAHVRILSLFNRWNMTVTILTNATINSNLKEKQP